MQKEVSLSRRAGDSLLENPIDIRELRGSDKIISNAPSCFPRVRGVLDEVMDKSFREVTQGVSVLNLSAALRDSNVAFAYQSDFSRRLGEERSRAQIVSRVGSVSVAKEVKDGLLENFEKDSPLANWGIEKRDVRERVSDDVVLLSLALAIQGSDVKVKPVYELTTAEVISAIRRAVHTQKKGEGSAADYLTIRGITRKTLIARGLCQDGSLPWHTGPNGRGLELLLPLGVGGEAKIEGQPPGGPPSVFDGHWERLGYSQREVDSFRRGKDTWWHNAETPHLLDLHTNTMRCLGRNPPDNVAAEKRRELFGLIDQGEDAFTTLTHHGAYKPVLDRMGVKLKDLLKLGVKPEQALKLGYSGESIKEAMEK